MPIDLPPASRERLPATDPDPGAHPGLRSGEGATATDASPGTTAFARVLVAVGRETERGERAIRAALDARRGRSDPADLLALQAAVYRYTEVVDLAARLLDRASSALKTVLGGGGS